MRAQCFQYFLDQSENFIAQIEITPSQNNNLYATCRTVGLQNTQLLVASCARYVTDNTFRGSNLKRKKW